jgi:C-terminal processing protease CtpA/Prc
MKRRNSRRSALALVAVLSTTACGDGGSPTRPSEPTSDLARAYLEQMIGFMQANSINRLTIDWTMFRSRVFDQASTAQTIADTHPAIRVALGLLGDGHSSYQSATGTVIAVPNRNCSVTTFPSIPTLPSTVGYVKVSTFAGVGAAATGYANELQSAIVSADRDDLIGWVVDVRGNGGGNMWPMVAGVGPVLGEGVVGYFFDPTGVENVWEYRDGASWHDGVVVQRVDAPYRLRRERPRVAVLTDNGVASSGEATVIAFIGRPNTRSFGTATCGLSTANARFTMSDGAALSLTVAVMADRTRTKYGDSIPPDEIVTDSRQVVQRALEWLQSGS